MGGAADESLYDAFLDACVAGTAPTPAAYFDAHPGLEPAMRARIESAYRLFDAPRTLAGDTMGASLPFESLGGYRVIRRLGLGGMGSVYVGEQDTLGRTVALKVIRSDLRESATVLRRFEREARAIAKLRHPNIVNVYEFGHDHDVHFIAMELIPGAPLDEVLRDRAPQPTEILSWMVQIARALAYAHAEGIVHRDIKPQNIMITPAGRPVLLDFGVARVLGTEVTKLTHDFAGTPQYAAPEQLLDGDDEVDGRTDVYALGVTLYEALTGRLPFEAGRLDELLLRIVREEPPPPRRVNPALPAEIELVILKAMEKQPARRYASAADLADDLQRLVEVRPVRARRPGLVTVLRKWARRRPVAATALAATLLLVGILVGFAVRGTMERRANARSLVAEARTLVEGISSARAAIRPETERMRAEQSQMARRYHTDAAWADFEGRVDLIDTHRRKRQSDFSRVSWLLGEARRLHAEVDGVSEVRAALLSERIEAARTDGDALLEGVYRRELRALDPHGTTRATRGARGRITLSSTPADCRVHIFRYRVHRELEKNGDRRLVPVSVLPPGMALPPDAQPGAHALRVLRGAGELRPGDLILRVAGQPVHGTVFAAADGEEIRRGDLIVATDERLVTSLWDLEPERTENVRSIRLRRGGTTYEVLEADRDVGYVNARGLVEQGGVTARVFTDGVVREITLAKGLVVHPTAAPRFVLPGGEVGHTPLTHGHELDAGSYLCVLRRDGYEDAILTATLDAGQELRLDVTLLPEGTSPTGFVFVPGPAGLGAGAIHPEDKHSFWIQSHEVTNGEFLAFLNDRARWKAAGAVKDYITVTPQLEPLFVRAQLAREVVRREPGGTFSLWNERDRHLPVVDVTWETARAYARWRSLREGRAYALPTLAEWLRAAGPTGRQFVFGNVFRPRWTSCATSRRGGPGSSTLEPTQRYPIDESPFGAYDMTGNAAEWLDQTWGPEVDGHMQYTGGAFLHTAPARFRLGGGSGLAKTERRPHVGLRLVLRSLERAR